MFGREWDIFVFIGDIFFIGPEADGLVVTWILSSASTEVIQAIAMSFNDFAHSTVFLLASSLW